jgi:hypothetical protein
MHRYRTSSRPQKTPIGEGMNTCVRLRSGLLILARVIWIIFAICNLISLPFGILAYYTQTLATGQSVPNVVRALTQMHLSAAQPSLATSLTVIYVFASVVFLANSLPILASYDLHRQRQVTFHRVTTPQTLRSRYDRDR